MTFFYVFEQTDIMTFDLRGQGGQKTKIYNQAGSLEFGMLDLTVKSSFN